MLNMPTSDCGSKVNCKNTWEGFRSFRCTLLFALFFIIFWPLIRKKNNHFFFLLPFSRIYQADEKTCKVCHEECDGSCIGPNTDHCKKCKHARDGPFCVPECPASKYNDNGVCKSCHGNCVGGCEGPENNIGPNGCHSCDKAILNDHVPEGCLQKKESCPDGRWPSIYFISMRTSFLSSWNSSTLNCTLQIVTWFSRIGFFGLSSLFYTYSVINAFDSRTL